MDRTLAAHRPLSGQYYTDGRGKKECLGLGAGTFVSGAALTAVFLMTGNAAGGLFCGLLAVCFVAFFLRMPSALWYWDRVRINDAGVRQRSFHRAAGYAEIEKLYIGFYQPRMGARWYRAGRWEKNFGPYIIGENKKGKICFAFCASEEIWMFLKDQCRGTASFIADENQYRAYLRACRRAQETAGRKAEELLGTQYDNYVN